MRENRLAFNVDSGNTEAGSITAIAAPRQDSHEDEYRAITDL
jgi:hypothetical protein